MSNEDFQKRLARIRAQKGAAATPERAAAKPVRPTDGDAPRGSRMGAALLAALIEQIGTVGALWAFLNTSDGRPQVLMAVADWKEAMYLARVYPELGPSLIAVWVMNAVVFLIPLVGVLFFRWRLKAVLVYAAGVIGGSFAIGYAVGVLAPEALPVGTALTAPAGWSAGQ